MYRILCIFSLIFLLTGCGINDGYNLNPSLPHAKIGLIPSNKIGTTNYLFLSDDNDTCTPNTRVSEFAPTVSINANKPISFIVYHTVNGYDTIFLAGTFLPKANHTYLIDITDELHWTYEIPSMSVLDQLSKEGKPYYQAVLFIPRKTGVHFFTDDVYCHSLTKTSTAS